MPTNATTFGTLVTRVRQRADMENSTFVSDVEIRTWLNSALAELHDIMILTFEDYYVNSTTYTLPGSDSNEVLTGSIDVTGTNTNVPGSGTAFLTELSVGDSIVVTGETRTIATITSDTAATVTSAWGSDLANDTSPEKIIPFGTLPDDFYKALGVDFETGGVTYTIKPFSFQERNMYNSNAGIVSGNIAALRYNIRDSLIKFIPTSPPSGTVTLYYAPSCQQFVTGTGDDTVTLNTKNKSVAVGYEEYIVISAAIKCLMKEESDVRMMLAEKADLQRRIENAAPRKDAGHPHKIVDVTVGTHADTFINLYN